MSIYCFFAIHSFIPQFERALVTISCSATFSTNAVSGRSKRFGARVKSFLSKLIVLESSIYAELRVRYPHPNPLLQCASLPLRSSYTYSICWQIRFSLSS